MRGLIKAFISEEDIERMLEEVVEKRDYEFKCKGYKIGIRPAEAESNNWFDIIVHIQDVDRPEIIREAIQKGIRSTLFNLNPYNLRKKPQDNTNEEAIETPRTTANPIAEGNIVRA